MCSHFIGPPPPRVANRKAVIVLLLLSDAARSLSKFVCEEGKRGWWEADGLLPVGLPGSWQCLRRTAIGCVQFVRQFCEICTTGGGVTECMSARSPNSVVAAMQLASALLPQRNASDLRKAVAWAAQQSKLVGWENS